MKRSWKGHWAFALATVTLSFVVHGCTDTVEPPTYGWEFREPLPDGAVRRDSSETGVPEPAESCVIEVTAHSSRDYFSMDWTVDDFGTVWFDGERVGSSAEWKQVQSFTEPVFHGEHVVAVRAEDRERVITGFIARAAAGPFAEDPSGCLNTGPGSAWRVITRPPPDGWRKVSFDDSHWRATESVASSCRSTWSGYTDLDPAKWIWSSNCNAGTANWNARNWYRLAFEVRLR